MVSVDSYQMEMDLARCKALKSFLFLTLSPPFPEMVLHALSELFVPRSMPPLPFKLQGLPLQSCTAVIWSVVMPSKGLRVVGTPLASSVARPVAGSISHEQPDVSASVLPLYNGWSG